jgi:hypothetical protein
MEEHARAGSGTLIQPHVEEFIRFIQSGAEHRVLDVVQTLRTVPERIIESSLVESWSTLIVQQSPLRNILIPKII